MVGNSNTLTLTIEVDDKGSPRIKQFAGSVESSAKKGEQSARRMGDEFDRTAKRISAGYGLIAGAMAALAGSRAFDLIQKSITLASDLEEMTSKFNVVFAGQEAIARRSTELLVEYYGVSTREARQYLASVQDLLVPMGTQSKLAADLSVEIVKLSADLGSFNNLPTAQVMGDIQSALVGNYETMKKYGVVLNEETVKRHALNLGLAKTNEELNAGQKAYAAFTIMVDDSKAAIGDKVRTLGSYANQLKAYHAAWEDTGAALGKAFIPTATKIIEKLRELAKEWQHALSPESLNKGDINKLVDAKFRRDLEIAEKALAYYEQGEQADRDERMAALRQEITLIRDKIALRQTERVAAEKTAGVGAINIPPAAGSQFTDKYGAAKSKKTAEEKELEREIKKAHEEFELARMSPSRLEEYESGLGRNAIARMEHERQQTIIAEQEKSWLIQAENDRANLAAKLAEYEKTHKGMLDLTERTAEAMQENFSSLFFDAMTGKLKSLADYANAVFNSIARMASDIMSQQLTRGLFGPEMKGGGALSALWKLFGGGAENLPINTPGAFAAAQPFARGGVIDRPTVFPFASGVGLMGEAGPEAIMPLKRNSRGELGVAAGGTIVNVYNYSGQPVQTRESRGPSGMRELEIMVAGMISKDGPVSRSMQHNFGISRRGAMRG